MNTVYIVLGTSGHGEEYIEWIVSVYPDKDSAEQHRKLAQEAINKTIENQQSLKENIKIPYDKDPIPWQELDIKYKVEEHRFTRHVDEYLDLVQE